MDGQDSSVSTVNGMVYNFIGDPAVPNTNDVNAVQKSLEVGIWTSFVMLLSISVNWFMTKGEYLNIYIYIGEVGVVVAVEAMNCADYDGYTLC